MPRFNDVNTRDRQLERVKGRVLCFTTSPNIEFVEKNLKFSYPLYHYDPSGGQTYPIGCAVSFMVELDGYLSFEKDAQIKLVELGPYLRPDFDPTRFVVVRPADPFVSTLTAFSLQYPNPDGSARRASIAYTIDTGGTASAEIQSLQGYQSPEWWGRLFYVGATWLGFDGYPNTIKRAEL